MIWLRQSTAAQIIALGPFLDSTDGNTEETSLTINAADIKIWKWGATSLVAKNSGGATHMANGVYYATLDATDTDTLGPLAIFVHVAGALFFRTAAIVLPANVYDALVAGSDYLDTNVVQWAGQAATADNEAATVVSPVSGSTITVYRGTTWSISLTNIGPLTSYDTIYFSVKHRIQDTENQAVLRVKNAASGLERFNGAAPTAAANGTITIDNAGTGDITITIQEEETQNAPLAAGLHYDVKGVDADGAVTVLTIGTTFNISGDVTRAIT